MILFKKIIILLDHNTDNKVTYIYLYNTLLFILYVNRRNQWTPPMNEPRVSKLNQSSISQRPISFSNSEISPRLVRRPHSRCKADGTHGWSSSRRLVNVGSSKSSSSS